MKQEASFGYFSHEFPRKSPRFVTDDGFYNDIVAFFWERGGWGWRVKIAVRFPMHSRKTVANFLPAPRGEK